MIQRKSNYQFQLEYKVVKEGKVVDNLSDYSERSGLPVLVSSYGDN
jgi:hypothetical protein